MDFEIALEYTKNVPPYRRLSDALRKAIDRGQFQPGAVLPPARVLAEKMGLSRATVLKGYEDLERQGFVETVSGRGTFVSVCPASHFSSKDLTELRVNPAPGDNAELALSAYGRRLVQLAASEPAAGDMMGLLDVARPPLEFVPLQQWKQALMSHCRLGDLSRLAYKIEPFGYPLLREALTAYLARSRAIRCDMQHVAVFSGGQFRVDILGNILLDPGDLVAVEEPSFPGARYTLSAHGAQVLPVPVDQQGINVDYLCQMNSPVRLVYVTPSHHDPTGAVLSLARRRQLLDWAGRTGAFILEDDYDCEYRYIARPLPALKSLDDADRVIYVSSFWKVLFPVLRMGFVVVPECLKRVFVLAKMKAERDLPLIEQFALADFVNGGHLERHIGKMRAIYDRRRLALLEALHRHLSGRVTVVFEAAGLHVLAQVESALADGEVLRRGRQCGLVMGSTQTYYVGESRPGEFVISFAHLNESLADGAVMMWARALSE